MSSSKQHPKHHLSAGAGYDASGWTESLTQLTEADQATSLLALDLNAGSKPPPTTLSHQGPGEGAAGCCVQGAAAGPPPSAPAPGARLSEGGEEASSNTPLGREGDFESALEHGLAVMAKEIEEVGEMVVEVGGLSGWGPSGLQPPQLAAVMARIQALADSQQVKVTKLRERVLESVTAAATVSGSVADVLVRKSPGPGRSPIEVRVAVIGNVDSGKSTLVGVLTRSMLDDGRGLARSKVFKHAHEEATGRTSSIGQHTLCLDAAGNVLNDLSFKSQTCGEYILKAAKVITLVDLAGHERYFRTTAYGLTGHMPDYACLIIGANMGVVGMCKEHMGVALALKVPVFFVISKVDICPDHILKQTVQVWSGR
ncbi:hypothetical protein QJQ45_024591 [Haematococcus lacustris]|nr:hypothetical protein QJQ45_024591 [Haematococcus lacustris]